MDSGFILKLERQLPGIVEKGFRMRFDEIRNNFKSKNVFKLEFLGCEMVRKTKMMNFVFSVNEVQTKVGIYIGDIMVKNFDDVFNEVLATLLLVNGGK